MRVRSTPGPDQNHPVRRGGGNRLTADRQAAPARTGLARCSTHRAPSSGGGGLVRRRHGQAPRHVRGWVRRGCHPRRARGDRRPPRTLAHFAANFGGALTGQHGGRSAAPQAPPPPAVDHVKRGCSTCPPVVFLQALGLRALPCDRRLAAMAVRASPVVELRPHPLRSRATAAWRPWPSAPRRSWSSGRIRCATGSPRREASARAGQAWTFLAFRATVSRLCGGSSDSRRGRLGSCGRCSCSWPCLRS